LFVLEAGDRLRLRRKQQRAAACSCEARRDKKALAFLVRTALGSTNRASGWDAARRPQGHIGKADVISPASGSVAHDCQ